MQAAEDVFVESRVTSTATIFKLLKAALCRGRSPEPRALDSV